MRIQLNLTAIRRAGYILDVLSHTSTQATSLVFVSKGPRQQAHKLVSAKLMLYFMGHYFHDPLVGHAFDITHHLPLASSLNLGRPGSLMSAWKNATGANLALIHHSDLRLLDLDIECLTLVLMVQL
jgi:hypothetical protein